MNSEYPKPLSETEREMFQYFRNVKDSNEFICKRILELDDLNRESIKKINDLLESNQKLIKKLNQK